MNVGTNLGIEPLTNNAFLFHNNVTQVGIFFKPTDSQEIVTSL